MRAYLPALFPKFAVQPLIRTSLQIATEHARKTRGTVKQSYTLTSLFFRIPARYKILRTDQKSRVNSARTTHDHYGKVPAFAKSDQEPNCIELRNIRDRGGAKGQNRPQYFQGRYENRWANTGRQNDSWHLANNIACSEDTAGVSEFTSLHIQRLFHLHHVSTHPSALISALETHPRDVCILDIRLIEILAEVPQACRSQEENVQLEEKPLLVLRLVWIVPDISLNRPVGST